MKVRAVRPELGVFQLEITAFEDTGSVWEVPFENVGHYQFLRGGVRVEEAQAQRFEEAQARFDRRITVPANEGTVRETNRVLQQEVEIATTWLREHSRTVRSGAAPRLGETRQGLPEAYADLQAFLGERGLGEMEAIFSRQFVSNPHSGDIVKGHRLTLAELGLVEYEGQVIRDSSMWSGDWSPARRARHILSRLAFVRALYGHLGHPEVVLYRGISAPDGLRAHVNRGFVSTSFVREVAEDQFRSYGDRSTGVLYRQLVPCERLFMTYVETEAMNRMYREAEAILLFDANQLAF
jgi:hypothetical protein